MEQIKEIARSLGYSVLDFEGGILCKYRDAEQLTINKAVYNNIKFYLIVWRGIAMSAQTIDELKTVLTNIILSSPVNMEVKQ